MRYILSDFKNYIINNPLQKLPNEINDIINKLVYEVGSPEYNKAPQFKQQFNNLKYPKKDNKLNNDWNYVKNFNTTKFNKQDGLENNMNNVRKLLNIITEKNYSKILEKIIKEIDVIAMKTPNDLLVFSKFIFDIISCHSLYSNLYAKLFTDLFDKLNNFKNLLDELKSNYKNKIFDITYCNPEIDYDKFCENNKRNEKNRAEFIFLSNLMNFNIIDYIIIYKLIISLFNILEEYIEKNDKKNEIDELSEIIYLVVTTSISKIKINNIENYNTIYSKVKQISNMKVKTSPGITNKCIFKHMDLLDKLL